MKISIGSKIVDGPWGGGNLFVKNLAKYLVKNGHDVIFDLSETDIDLILLTDPRSRKESSSTFNHIEINNYKKYVNNKVKGNLFIEVGCTMPKLTEEQIEVITQLKSNITK